MAPGQPTQPGPHTPGRCGDMEQPQRNLPEPRRYRSVEKLCPQLLSHDPLRGGILRGSDSCSGLCESCGGEGVGGVTLVMDLDRASEGLCRREATSLAFVPSVSLGEAASGKKRILPGGGRAASTQQSAVTQLWQAGAQAPGCAGRGTKNHSNAPCRGRAAPAGLPRPPSRRRHRRAAVAGQAGPSADARGLSWPHPVPRPRTCPRPAAAEPEPPPSPAPRGSAPARAAHCPPPLARPALGSRRSPGPHKLTRSGLSASRQSGFLRRSLLSLVLPQPVSARPHAPAGRKPRLSLSRHWVPPAARHSPLPHCVAVLWERTASRRWLPPCTAFSLSLLTDGRLKVCCPLEAPGELNTE